MSNNNTRETNTIKLLSTKTGALSVLSFGREFLGTRYTRPVFPPIISLRVSGVITVAFEP
jgi:hypothetical protein